MNAVRSDSVDFFLGTTTPAGFFLYDQRKRKRNRTKHLPPDYEAFGW